MSIDYMHSPAVVLFDSQTSRDSGWACIAGEEPVPIRSPADLSSGAVWWTNLDFDTFISSQLNRSNRFREAGYIRTPFTAAAAEIGATIVDNGRMQAKGRESCKALATYFSSIMQASWAFGVKGFPPHALRLGYRQALYSPRPSPAPSQEVLAALHSACQAYTFTERRHDGRVGRVKERIVSMVRHRYSHAYEVLSQPVPVGVWRKVPLMSSREIFQHQLPLLLRVKVHRTDDTLGSLINFGGNTGRATITNGRRGNDAIPREWMTLPEYRFLAPHSEIEVLEIIEGEGYMENPLMEMLPFMDPVLQISPACMIGIENLWACALKDSNNRLDYSPISVWMQAYDRILCCKDSVKIIDRDPNADITFFAYGRISARTVVPDEELGGWFANIIRNTFLLPPLCTESPFDFVRADEANPVEIAQALQLLGDPSILAHNDEFALTQLKAPAEEA